ncbi:probable magnesium transporter NIPA4 isoform X3 [Hevea brasiliensis]|uniref:probable magnesium transporter NIPA4 isoform X3 n=1 Tax=Hevea brasiliensis TaxID=3981 RepID=UPI0025F9242A|nr:probable magnesium transporter NIPA4 isoform X3 [Hevea brasiliensis]
MADSDKGMSSDNIKGLVLALSSSLFIGASFIVKKKGLKKAGASGLRAGAGGYSYLYEPLWWIGMITTILVTPLGALSIIISAALAHVILREKLHIFGILGCALCVVGSTTIVLHAPQEREIESVKEVWELATEPAFLFYATFVIGAVFIIIVRVIPQYGQTHVMVYIAVCSLVGSLSVMSVKAIGIALKLTFSGMNQLVYPQTWAFTLVVAICVITQMNYLNKALDTFNTAVVSPIYYVMFTSLTILASVIMFKFHVVAANPYIYVTLTKCSTHGLKTSVVKGARRLGCKGLRLALRKVCGLTQAQQGTVRPKARLGEVGKKKTKNKKKKKKKRWTRRRSSLPIKDGH